jgi:hypothetical protein
MTYSPLRSWPQDGLVTTFVSIRRNQFRVELGISSERCAIQELVIGGYVPVPKMFDSILVGYHDSFAQTGV